MTEEAFLLSSLKEVVKVWGKGTGHATFNFSVENGKGTLQLGFQLGLPHDLHDLPLQHSHRKGPSRCERDHKRASEHQAHVQTLQAKATSAEHDETAQGVTKLDETAAEIAVQDEFCSDENYVENVVNNDTLVEEILVKPDDCQADLKDEYVENLIDYNFKIKGINVVKIKINRSNRGAFTSCLVKIEPIPLKRIESESFPLRNWSLKAIS